MENKYPEGSIVYANENPDVKLVVRRYVQRIYYCRTHKGSSDADLVYFEREIHAGTSV